MAQVGVSDARSVGLDAEQLGAGDEQASIEQPVDGPAAAPTAGAHDLAVPLEVDRDDLVRPPVREPEASLVPPGRLPHAEAVQQDPGVRDRSVRHGVLLPEPTGVDRGTARKSPLCYPGGADQRGRGRTWSRPLELTGLVALVTTAVPGITMRAALYAQPPASTPQHEL